jgi:hypothetical protein
MDMSMNEINDNKMSILNNGMNELDNSENPFLATSDTINTTQLINSNIITYINILDKSK